MADYFLIIKHKITLSAFKYSKIYNNMTKKPRIERERERESIFSFQNLLKAYQSCRKLKRKSFSAANFELHLEQNLFDLENELKTGSYIPRPLTCFPITDPKLREVWASDFRDRIVHHLLVNYLEPIFEKKFIFHSYACRKNKGSHRAVSAVQRAITADNSSSCEPQTDNRLFQSGGLSFFQTDIQSFFVSVDKGILLSIIKRSVKRPEIIWLTEKIISQNPTINCHVKGDKNLLNAIPAHKSLFRAPANKGLPIGNLTSQFFANVYLNELDQFVKHSLKCRYYFRYMDDFILFSPFKWELQIWRDEIDLFLSNRLKLKLHPKKQIIGKTNQGIDFCGYIIKPDYLLIRRRTVNKLKMKLRTANQHIADYIRAKTVFRDYPTENINDTIFNDPFIVFESWELKTELAKIFSSINSTYGSLRHANCFSLRKSLYMKHFGFLRLYMRPIDANFSYFCWDDLSGQTHRARNLRPVP
jgi:retron-type reverse transcriptase